MSDISVPHLLELIRFDFQNVRNGTFPELEAIRSWGNYFDVFFQRHQLDICDKILRMAQGYAPYLCESCQARIQLAEGELHHQRGNWNKAKQCYMKCLELRYILTRKEADPSLLAVRKSAVAQALYRLGKLSFDEGNFRQAERRYLQALHRIQWYSIEDSIDQYLTGLAEAYRVQGKYVLAEKSLREAKTFAERKLKETREPTLQKEITNQLAMILLDLGLIQIQLSKFVEAMMYFRESLDSIQNTENKVLLAVVNHQLGIVYQIMGETDTAKHHYEKTIAISKVLRDESRRASGSPHSKADTESLRLIAASRHQYGMIYQSQGDYLEAEKQYEAALATWQQEDLQNRLGEAQTRHQLGALYQDLRQHAETQELREQYEAMAHEQYKAALRIEQESGDSAGEVWTLYQLGMLLQEQDDYILARERYENSIRVAQRIKDRTAEARGLHQIGITYQNEGKHTEAFQRYMNALKLWREIKDRSSEAQTMYQMGLVCQAQEKYDQAKKWHIKALLIERHLKNQPEIVLNLLHIGINHQVQGQYDNAMRVYMDALNLAALINDQEKMHSLLWQLTTLSEKEGDCTSAIQFITQILADFPSDCSQYSVLNGYLEHLRKNKSK